MSRILRAKIPEPLDPEVLPLSARREIQGLRRQEVRVDTLSTLEQFRANHLFALYGRKIDVDHRMAPGEWKVLEPIPPKKGDAPALTGAIWRRGRVGGLPSRQTLQAKHWIEVTLAPDIADKVIERDKS